MQSWHAQPWQLARPERLWASQPPNAAAVTGSTTIHTHGHVADRAVQGQHSPGQTWMWGA